MWLILYNCLISVFDLFCHCRPERFPSFLHLKVAWCSWRTPSSQSTSRRRICSGCRRTWTKLCPVWTMSSVTTTWPKTRTGSFERGEGNKQIWSDIWNSLMYHNFHFLSQTYWQTRWVSCLYRQDSESCGILSRQQPRQPWTQHCGTVSFFVPSSMSLKLFHKRQLSLWKLLGWKLLSSVTHLELAQRGREVEKLPFNRKWPSAEADSGREVIWLNCLGA